MLVIQLKTEQETISDLTTRLNDLAENLLGCSNQNVSYFFIYFSNISNIEYLLCLYLFVSIELKTIFMILYIRVYIYIG